MVNKVNKKIGSREDYRSKYKNFYLNFKSNNILRAPNPIIMQKLQNAITSAMLQPEIQQKATKLNTERTIFFFIKLIY